MIIDIVGEDPVTRSIIERLLADYRKDLIIGKSLPARGGQIKSFAPKYNLLGTPIFLLTDLDEHHCPPSLINDWFGDKKINNQYLFRIAQEEAETWLMADREGFSNWLDVDIKLIPEPKIIDKKKNIREIICPTKPSLYMMLNIASKSSQNELKENLTPKKGAGKGPLYNATLIPFIKDKWNINNAINNSYSLEKAVKRLVEF